MTHRRRVRILIAMALVLATALVVNWRAGESRGAEERPPLREGPALASAEGASRVPSRAEFLRLLAAAQAEQHERAKERDHDHPHPITRDHERLYRDVDLLHAADEAIKAGAYDQARALLAEHHRELGGMSAVEEEGLWLLADCAEHGGAENVERVRSFYEEHTDSTVRRRLRRACLERRR